MSFTGRMKQTVTTRVNIKPRYFDLAVSASIYPDLRVSLISTLALSATEKEARESPKRIPIPKIAVEEGSDVEGAVTKKATVSAHLFIRKSFFF